MKISRTCSKPTCNEAAVATMTYSQADQMVVLGPLAVRPTPHTYDLCASHVERFTAPVGWELIRLHTQFDAVPAVSDIEALVDTIRCASEPDTKPQPETPPTQASITQLGPYLT